MQKLLTALLLTLILGSSLPAAHAQEADMAYFASFEGLNRVFARSWMAPIPDVGSGGQVSPVASPESSPVATPETQSTIGALSIFVFLFDSDDNAADGWQRIDADLQKTVLQDSRAPMTDDLPLEGMGDQARGYMGDLTFDGITTTHTFATVQDGPFVYSLSGMFSDTDSVDFMQSYISSLIAGRMDRMVEQYHPDGSSRGGLWHKLNTVEPAMPDGSTVTDFIVYPMEATPMASAEPMTYRMQSGNLANIEGIQDVHGITYQRGDVTSTPDPNETGIFRITTWIMAFDSDQNASNAVSPLANVLTQPINVNATSNSTTQSNDILTTSTTQTGSILDNSLPPGRATVHVRQEQSTVYVVAVYAVDEDPAPIAKDLAQQMIDTPASNEPETSGTDGTMEGGVWARFPVAGDPLLGDTVPVKSVQPVGQPPATPGS